MSPTWTTFLFEAANFLILAAVLGWLFFKPVRQALAQHRERYEADTRQAAEKLAEAERTRQELDDARARLEADLEQLRTRELATARERAEQILDEARAAAGRELEMSRRQATRMSEAQRDVLAEGCAAAAAETVGRLLQQIRGPELQAALVDAACRQLAELPRDKLSPVIIESDQPLAGEQQAALRAALGTVAEMADFRTVNGLGAGVRISTASGLINATVSGLTQFARHTLVAEMHRRANNHNPLQSSNHG